MYVVFSQGGNGIDDVFGCIVMNTNGMIKIAPLDTYNVHGSNKLNLGDGGLVSSVNLYTYYDPVQNQSSCKAGEAKNAQVEYDNNQKICGQESFFSGISTFVF